MQYTKIILVMVLVLFLVSACSSKQSETQQEGQVSSDANVDNGVDGSEEASKITGQAVAEVNDVKAKKRISADDIINVLDFEIDGVEPFVHDKGTEPLANILSDKVVVWFFSEETWRDLLDKSSLTQEERAEVEQARLEVPRVAFEFVQFEAVGLSDEDLDKLFEEFFTSYVGEEASAQKQEKVIKGEKIIAFIATEEEGGSEVNYFWLEGDFLFYIAELVLPDQETVYADKIAKEIISLYE